VGSDFTPFKGRTVSAPAPTRLLKRFAKSAHIAEIHEREVKPFEAIEFIVFVDGSLLESQMFHGRRLEAYAPALVERSKRFADDGWLEQPVTSEPIS
jgi:hypothetical protein